MFLFLFEKSFSVSFYWPKAGPYVALTLQGPPPSAASLPLEPLPTDLTPNQKTSLGGEAPPPPPPPLPSGPSSNPSQRITGPKPLQVNEIILRIDIIRYISQWPRTCVSAEYINTCFKIKYTCFVVHYLNYLQYLLLMCPQGPRSTKTCHSDTQENAGAGRSWAAGNKMTS